MEIERLLELLAATDEETRQEARRALEAKGAAAVPALVETLLDENSAVDWGDAAIVLGQIGVPAFAAVRDALAAATTAEAQRRAGWAFTKFPPEEATPLYIQALRHPSPTVRADAAYALGNLGVEATGAGPALVELLGDPVEEVAERAAWALAELGPSVVGLLERARRSPVRVVRRRALEALRETVGDDGLRPRDRAVLERLVRLRLCGDRPTPFEEASWLAVAGGDQAGILELLELSHPRPATFAMGLSAVREDWQAGFSFSAPEYPELTRVFVTPELDGWTLVVGPWCGPYAEVRQMREIVDACRRLSARYGATQAYAPDLYSDACSWVLAANGTVHRQYAWSQEAVVDEGEPPPCELAGRARHPGTSIVLSTYEVAACCSISSRELGPSTPMRGHGLLARTPYGRLHGEPRRALPL